MQNPLFQCRNACIAAFIVICTLVIGLANAQVFAPNIKVDDGEPFAQYAPSIAKGPHGELYVLFDDMREGGDMYFARSLDGGKTWSNPNIRVSDTCICDWGMPSCLVVDNLGTIYACWQDNREDEIGGSGIYFSASTDGGHSWSTNVRASDSSHGGRRQPSMVIAPDHSLCVVFTDHRHGTSDPDIYFSRSTDGGATWTDPNIRVDDGSIGAQMCPCICADQWGNLYVGYSSRPDTSEEPFHVYLVRSTDYGETWSSPAFRIDDGRPAEHYYLSLKASPTGIYAVWSMYGFGMDNIVFSKSTDGGETWSRPVIQVDHIGSGLWSEAPDFAIGDDGTLYVTWVRWDVYGDALPDIFFGLSTDDGQTWTDPSIRVNDVKDKSQLFPEIAISNNQTAYIAWQDSRGGDLSTQGIYFSRTIPVSAYGEADEREVPRGGKLGVTVTLINNTGLEQVADAWTGVVMPNSKPYKGNPVLGPQTVTLVPYDTLSKHVNHKIPNKAPLGDYRYQVKAGEEYPDFLSKDTFTFTVVEGVANSHLRVIER